jgi:hypothetical protein
MSSRGESLSLFAEPDSPVQAGSIDGQVGEEGQQEKVGSIEWYARRQADLRAAGEASATAYWAKKGVKYP